MSEFTDFDKALKGALRDLQHHSRTSATTQVAWNDEVVPVTITAAPLPNTLHEVVCELPAGTPEALIDSLWDHVDNTVAEAQDVGTRDGDNGKQLLVFDYQVTRAA